MSVAQIIMSLVGSAVLLAGYLLSRRGASRDEQSRQVKDQFERMLSEITYWQGVADTEREARAKDRTEAEGRWSRQMKRCRDITDGLAQTIVRLMKLSPGGDAAAESSLRDLEEHNEIDHSGDAP